MVLPEFVNGFAALKSQTYLSICDKMILHSDVRAAVDTFMDRLETASTDRVGHEIYVESCRKKFADLVGAKPSEIAIGRNVSDGLNALIWSMGLKAGDNVVLCLDLEHPNNIYPWLRLGSLGVELRCVPQCEGRLDYGAMIDAIDDDTRILSCASVSFAPGYRADLQRLSEATRKRDVFLLVDGVQSAGIMRHDLHAQGVDGFATSTSKGLLGLYGFGYLFVSETWLDRLNPAYLSRTGVELGNNNASALGDLDYVLKPNAGRFEVGSYNLAGAYASDAALTLLQGVGSAQVEAQALEIAADLREGMEELGVPNLTTGASGEMSNIVTAGPLDAGGHGFSQTDWVTSISKALEEARVKHTIRRGQLRFGTHAYNTQEDVQLVLDVIKKQGRFS